MTSDSSDARARDEMHREGKTMPRRKSDRCECGHERVEHSKHEGCEAHIDRDPAWGCKCKSFVLDREAIAFAQGVLAALTIVRDHDNAVAYGEIVDLAGGAAFLVSALDPQAPGEDAQHYGLAKYGYTTRSGRLRRASK